MTADDATALGAFFEAFRQQTDALAAELSGFFKTFAGAYQNARDERATSTPHLDVLRVFGLQFAELRHSDVLAWFLKPTGEHEQGPLFVNGLLRYLRLGAIAGESYTVLRERHEHTDVACYSRKQFAIFIENKVRSGEREEQFSKMVRSLVTVAKEHDVPPERRFAIFLTDSGAPPETAPPADTPEFTLKNVKPMSRVEVFTLFRAALPERPDRSCSHLLINLLESYQNAIRRVRAEIS